MFNVLLTYFMLGQRTSLAAIACCGTIVAGFYLGVDQVTVFGDCLLIFNFLFPFLRKTRLAVSPCQEQCMEFSLHSSYHFSPFLQKRCEFYDVFFSYYTFSHL